MFLTGINATVNNGPEVIDGAQAAAAAINKEGGFGGRPVEITGCSHQSTSAGAGLCAQKAVDEKFDWVLEVSAFTSGSDPILQNGGVPYAGSSSQTGADYKDPNRFPSLAASGGLIPAACASAVKASKGKRVLIVSVDLAATLQSRTMCRLEVQRLGGTFLGIISSPNIVTDLSPVVLKAKQMNPDVVVIALSVAPALTFLKTAAQFGLNPIYVIAGSSANEATFTAAGIPNLNVYIGSQFPSPQSKLPGMTRFKQDIAAAGFSGDLKTASQLTMTGWGMVWSLGKVAATVKGAVTKDTLLAKIKQTKSVDVFGLFHWLPGSKGPSLFPNQPWGEFFVNKYDATGQIVPASTKPVDIYAAAGFGKTNTRGAVFNPAKGWTGGK